jgi:hypothetical protein
MFADVGDLQVWRWRKYARAKKRDHEKRTIKKEQARQGFYNNDLAEEEEEKAK